MSKSEINKTQWELTGQLDPYYDLTEEVSDKLLLISKKKILIVEDEALSTLYLEFCFQRLNLTFDIAKNGREALLLLLRKKYDLMLMNIEMPYMTGIEALRIIRTDLGMNIPVIALSAYEEPNIIESVLKAGAQAYLIKPVRIKRLIECLLKVLS